MKTLEAGLKGLATINAWLTSIGKTLAWLLVGAMVASILLQVVMRYGFNAALPWPEEAARACMLWMMACVAAPAYRNGMFVSIDSLLVRLRGNTLVVLKLLLLLLALMVLVQLFQLSLEFFQRGFRVRAASLPVARAWVYLSMPVCFGSMLLVNLEMLLEQSLRLWQTLAHKEQAAC